jgi:hypothetical protein
VIKKAISTLAIFYQITDLNVKPEKNDNNFGFASKVIASCDFEGLFMILSFSFYINIVPHHILLI